MDLEEQKPIESAHGPSSGLVDEDVSLADKERRRTEMHRGTSNLFRNVPWIDLTGIDRSSPRSDRWLRRAATWFGTSPDEKYAWFIFLGRKRGWATRKLLAVLRNDLGVSGTAIETAALSAGLSRQALTDMLWDVGVKPSWLGELLEP